MQDSDQFRLFEMVLCVRGAEAGGVGRRGAGEQPVGVTRKYRRKTNRQLVSFLHRSNADGSTSTPGEEVKIYKQ